MVVLRALRNADGLVPGVAKVTVHVTTAAAATTAAARGPAGVIGVDVLDAGVEVVGDGLGFGLCRAQAAQVPDAAVVALLVLLKVAQAALKVTGLAALTQHTGVQLERGMMDGWMEC